MRRIALFFLILVLLGAGCGKGKEQSQSAPAVKQEQAAVRLDDKTVNQILAYVRLNGGQAQVTRAGRTVAAEEGTELLQGDEVRAVSGDVELVYPNAGISQLSESTQIVILPVGEDGDSVLSEIRLLAGSIWTRFERLLGVGEQFSVVANGVVATVRGTAFGLAIENGNVDIQVAENEVIVTSEDMEEAEVMSKVANQKFIRLSAGQGLRARAELFRQLELPRLKSLVRTLSVAERAKLRYRFLERRILRERFQRPLSPKRLDVTPRVPEQFERRMDLLRRRILQPTGNTFVPPTRGVLPQEVATSTLMPR